MVIKPQPYFMRKINTLIAMAATGEGHLGRFSLHFVLFYAFSVWSLMTVLPITPQIDYTENKFLKKYHFFIFLVWNIDLKSKQ